MAFHHVCRDVHAMTCRHW